MKATEASQNVEREKKQGRTDHMDVYLHLTNSKPGRENAMKIRMSRITRRLMDVLSYKTVMPRQNQKPCLFAMTATEFHVRVVVL